MKSVRVVCDIRSMKDNIFTYLVPPSMVSAVRIGSRVLVPLGSRQVYGYVVDWDTNPDNLHDNCSSRSSSSIVYKELISVLEDDTFLNKELVELAYWMSEKYLCSVASCLQTIVSPKVSRSSGGTDEYLSAVESEEQKELIEYLAARAHRQYKVWNWLREQNGPVLRRTIPEELNCSSAVIRNLEEKGLVRREKRSRLPGFFDYDPRSQVQELQLTEEQSSALQEIKKDICRKNRASFLVHGVTGSGKTELYLQAIEETVKFGRQAIMMVPEIALTPQVIDAFKIRFADRIAVLHSMLTPGEKKQQLKRICDREADVIIGTRSAVFAPCDDLGLIIIDEEHEHTYKQEENPKYITQEVAHKRADQNDSVLIVGSATPSLETYYYAKAGRYKILQLKERINKQDLPRVIIVDQREENKKGNKHILSEALLLGIQERLAKNEQCLLFLNRRGYASFVNCRSCGHVFRCPHCDISLTMHRYERSLKCHYCGYSMPQPYNCPQCGSSDILNYGLGTQKLEKEVRELFPQAAVLRMDSDTMRHKGSQDQLYRQFRSGQADILIGTQMIAKGFHFPEVTLVGVVSADVILNLPDFRAAERTFQLLTQVSGRAGRGSRPGEVVIQTYNPEHYAIRLAASQDYSGFVSYELRMRKMLAYPPFTTLARIIIQGTDESEVNQESLKLSTILQKMITNGYEGLIELIGPAPAPLSKLKDNYRWHFLLKGKRQLLTELIGKIGNEYPSAGSKLYERHNKVKLIIDLVPQMML